MTRGDSLLSRALAFVLRIPRASRPGDVGVVEVVTTTQLDGSEQWQRTFRVHNESGAGSPSPAGVSTFNTRQDIREEQLVEFYGPLEYTFDVVFPIGETSDGGDGSLQGNSFLLVLKKFRVGVPGVCMLPMPSVLSPVVVGTTTHIDSAVETACAAEKLDSGQGQGWLFCVSVRGPKWLDPILGLIFQYEGKINDIKR